MSSSRSENEPRVWTIYVCPNCGHWHGSSYFNWPADTPPLCKIKGYGQDGKRSCGAAMEPVEVAAVEGHETEKMLDDVIGALEQAYHPQNPIPDHPADFIERTFRDAGGNG